jgi:RNA polymerase-binding transcription factor DksA
MPESNNEQNPQSVTVPRRWKLVEQQLRADSAAESEIRDVEFVHRGALRQRILQIERALEQIKLGTYGRCTACRRAIDAARLTKTPDVQMCLACETELEGERAPVTM